MEFSDSAIGLLLGIPMTVFGSLAYAGRWRSWVTMTGLNPRGKTFSGLGLLYAGIGFCLVPLVALFDPAWDALRVTLLLAAVAGIWIFIISFFWLPVFARPRWLRSWEARGCDPREFPVPRFGRRRR
ncbi:hypothetical protein [Arthrobacter castelli]|uniref:hypothetical protein n=1 Tax=Arthrobacter castelli TaxID=271431 RepID=UPI0004058840|nr:hypothetical protein [Arthrobacter castelli]